MDPKSEGATEGLRAEPAADNPAPLEATQRKMTNLGRSTLVTETSTNLSIPVFVCTMEGELTYDDVVHLMTERLLRQHPRFRSVVQVCACATQPRLRTGSSTEGVQSPRSGPDRGPMLLAWCMDLPCVIRGSGLAVGGGGLLKYGYHVEVLGPPPVFPKLLPGGFKMVFGCMDANPPLPYPPRLLLFLSSIEF